MPWRECSAADERLRVVACLLDGEARARSAVSSGVARKTGYKMEHGLEAFKRSEIDLVEGLLRAKMIVRSR